MSRVITRRTVLKGLGASVALPWLEAMSPRRAFAAASAQAPSRMAFIFVPNGKMMQDWTPAASGRDFQLPATLEPLADVKDYVTVFSNLSQRKAFANGDGPGDHARAASTFLTGVQVKKTQGKDIRAGKSVDQVAAAKVGHLTRFASLELGCEHGPNAGGCDSGYSCAYSHNISWRSESTPMSKEINPRLVFERLFSNEVKGEVQESLARRQRLKKSILDFVHDDAKELRKQLGVVDQRKLDEYLVSIREIEERLVRSDKRAAEELPKIAEPDGIPKDYREHLRLMNDMLVVAFQGDVTRIATFMFANAGSNRSYPTLEISDGHHELSHHGGNQEKHAKLRRINRFHVEQLAYLLGKMKSVKEGAGTLLDNVMLMYGSGIGDGDRHNHDKLPILVAGKGRGTIRGGQHIVLSRETPLNNLFLAMLDRMGAPVNELGDSTGRLKELDG